MADYRLSRKTPDETPIIACTEEQVVSLRKLCKTSPQRVVQILNGCGEVMHASRGFKAGSQAFFAAIVAVGELLKGTPVGADKVAAWKKLVDAGVVDALIANVLNSAPAYIETLPGMPEDLKQRALNELHAPYFPAMEILSNASRVIIRPQDQIFLSALKSNWSAMMERIWNEPFNSLRPEENHIFERFVVAALFCRVVVADHSFLDIAYKDLTIPLITRHWVYSGSCAVNQADASITSTTLFLLMNPKHPQFKHLKQYMRENRNTLSLAQLFAQMCLGAGRTPYAAKKDQTKALVDAFGTRFEILNGADVEPVMEMALELLDPIVGERPDAFAQALVANDVFWRGLFNLMQRIQKGQGRDISGQPTEKRLLALPIVILSTAFGCMAGRAQGELLCTCARAGFFDALDEVIEDLVEVKKDKKNQLLAHICTLMRDALVQCTADERTTLAAQFPRWRTTAALFLNDVKSQGGLTEAPSRTTILPAQLAWQMFVSLHAGCKPAKQCARRGCDKRGTARCATCKAVLYCGSACQKTDWKGHKRLCSMGGWMEIVGQEMAKCDTEQIDTLIRENGGVASRLFGAGKPGPAPPSLNDLD